MAEQDGLPSPSHSDLACSGALVTTVTASDWQSNLLTGCWAWAEGVKRTHRFPLDLVTSTSDERV